MSSFLTLCLYSFLNYKFGAFYQELSKIFRFFMSSVFAHCYILYADSVTHCSFMVICLFYFLVLVMHAWMQIRCFPDKDYYVISSAADTSPPPHQ